MIYSEVSCAPREVAARNQYLKTINSEKKQILHGSFFELKGVQGLNDSELPSSLKRSYTGC